MDSFIKAFKELINPLNDKCKKCDCMCSAFHFQQNFDNWTSGNEDIDEFIQNIQLSAHRSAREVLEWIPYYKFYAIKKSSFSEIYGANWIDGNISHWDSEKQTWKRENQNMIVTIKMLDNSKKITVEFINEV
jgi:hypothetical protein